MKNDPTLLSQSRPNVLRWEAGRAESVRDELVVEEPLEIRVRGQAISVTMRTPGHDEELAAGFLLTENVIAASQDVLKITACERNEEGNLINVQLAPDVQVDFDQLTRHVFASSSCGLCGKASIDAISQHFSPVQSDVKFSPELITTFPERMRQHQATFNTTGGLHAAAIFDSNGKLLVLREDVGRHNAVDKVLGRCLLDRLLPLSQHLLLVSGRLSFEILQKALAGRVPIIAGVSAPSNLAVDFAHRNGQTLIGFLRGSRMNIYTHPHRLGLQT
ncbi:MAG TPA: formate dehydrogenase accessory sulfurtransferase FdhD [Tepidisphaeraceae bacterium]|jgi:FdhD protein